MKKYLLLLIILILPATLVLLKPGFFPSHDGDWMVIRLSAFHQSLRDGQFPVRWSHRLNQNFGYPVLNFLYPLPFYFGEIFYLFSHSFVQAVKAVFTLSFFGSALTMFLWLRRRYSVLASLTGAVLYVYTPYRFVDTYVRGSIGESLSFVFVPLIFWAIDVLPRKTRTAVIIGALAAAATLLSHNVFVVFIILGLVYGLITLPKKSWPYLFLMMFFAAAISAYFWFPALTELKYVYASHLQVANPIDNLVSLKALILPSWGYGPSTPGNPNSMSFQVGLVNLAIVIVSVVLVLKRILLAKFFLLIFFVALFFMHTTSSFLWHFLPGIGVIQFPWRLLAVTTFSTAALAAMIIDKTKAQLLAVGCIILAILLTRNYAQPVEMTFVPDQVYTTNEDTTTVRQEYMPIWVTDVPQQRLGDRVIFIRGRGVISQLKETNREFIFRVEASEPATVKLAAAYYPGWQVSIKGEPVAIDYSHNGMIAVAVPQGASKVRAYWTETPEREFANYISLITLLAILSHVICLAFWKPTKKP